MKLEIFLDFFFEDIRLFKDRLVVLQSNFCGLNFFVAETSVIDCNVDQDLRKSLIRILLKQLKYFFYIESVLRH